MSYKGPDLDVSAAVIYGAYGIECNSRPAAYDYPVLRSRLMRVFIYGLAGAYKYVSRVVPLGLLEFDIISPLPVVSVAAVNVLIYLVGSGPVINKKILKIILAASSPRADKDCVIRVDYDRVPDAAHYDSLRIRLVNYERILAVECNRGALVPVRELLEIFNRSKLVPFEVSLHHGDVAGMFQHLPFDGDPLYEAECVLTELDVASGFLPHRKGFGAGLVYVGVDLAKLVEIISRAHHEHAEISVERCLDDGQVLGLLLEPYRVTVYVSVAAVDLFLFLAEDHEPALSRHGLGAQDGIGVTRGSVDHDIGRNDKNKFRRLQGHKSQRYRSRRPSRNVLEDQAVCEPLESLELIVDDESVLSASDDDELVAIRHIACNSILKYGMILCKFDELLWVIAPGKRP